MLGKVLIGSRSFGKFTNEGIELLKKNGCQIVGNPFHYAIKEKDLLNLISDIDGIITGMDQLTKKVLNSSTALKVISKHGVGVDNIDIEAASKKNIFVTNIPTVKEESNAVADFTFALLLSIAKNICQSNESTKKGKWLKLIGSEVYGKTIGIIGGGVIGKSVIKRALGFGMNVLVYDLYENEELVKNYNAEYVDLDYLLKNADFITIHVPLNHETKNLIGRKELKMMKKYSYLINTARGGIVNEKDLYEALKEKRIAGAALDVFLEEPPKANPLLELDNLIATPHVAAYTMSCMCALDKISAQNVIDVLKFSKPSEKYLVNKVLM